MSSFQFKQFAIEQDRTAMKVGTDGVLLGAWVSLTGEEHSILDVGCGTALIAIMMAQRAPLAEIVGVEIDPQSAEQAAENMARSPWAERLSVVCSPIQKYEMEGRKFDLIVSNPPYFVNSLHAKGESRTLARHTDSLSFGDLIGAVKRALSDDGIFAVILPTVESQLFDTEAQEVLHLSRRTLVRGKKGGETRRVMSEYRLFEGGEVVEDEISIRDKTTESGYSSSYQDITFDFYLDK